MANGCQRNEKRRSGSIRSTVMSNRFPAYGSCIFATAASALVGAITPETGAPALNGPSNFTPNHWPNSCESVSAFHTRARGARKSTCFSIRPVTSTGICNLLVAILHRRILKCNLWVARQLRQPAGEARGVVGVAAALVFRDLREPAERARLVHRAVGAVRRDDLRRRAAAGDPLLDRGHLVEDVGARAALAVHHARHHEERDPFGGRVLADRLHDLVVVDRARLRRDLLIAPPVIHEQLAAAIEERPEVRVAGEERAAVGLRGFLDPLRDLEAPPVPFRILVENVREAGGREAERRRAAEIRPPALGARPQIPLVDRLASPDVFQ